MNSTEVAKILHIDEEEFRRIEPSVANVFHLSRNEDGRFEYSSEHLAALRQLFEEALGGAPDLPEVDESTRQREEQAKRLLETENLFEKSGETPDVPRAIELNAAPKNLKWSVHKGSVREKQEETLADGRRVVSATDIIERLQAKQSNHALRHKKVESRTEPDEAMQKMMDLLKEQREFIEARLGDREEVERLKSLREVEELKRENHQLRRRVDTLKNMVQSQNEDKKYLIEKLNRKYSLWNLIQWQKERTHIGDQDPEFSEA